MKILPKEQIVGTIDKDGKRQYPPSTIIGGVYTRPATTVGIGKGLFVVLPVGFKDKDLLTAVRETYGDKQATVKPKEGA